MIYASRKQITRVNLKVSNNDVQRANGRLFLRKNIALPWSNTTLLIEKITVYLISYFVHPY